jgi:type II secretion system protein C
MTKKKKGIFSKLKDKFSKSDEEYEDEYEEYEDEYEEDDYEEKYHSEYEEDEDAQGAEDEFAEDTGDIQVDPDLLAQSTDTTKEVNKVTEGTNHNITFDSLEKDEDEIEDLLNTRSDSEEPPQFDEDEEDDEEEEFVATEFKVSQEQKEELNELNAPRAQIEDEEFEEDYEDELYDNTPKQSVQQKFASFLANIKEKLPKSTKSKIDFEGGTIDDSPSKLSDKFSMPSLSNISWSTIVEKSFSPDSRQLIHKSFITALVLGSSYYTGKLVANSVSSKLTPKSVKSRARVSTPVRSNYRDQAKFITKANLFNTVDPQTEVAGKKDDKPKIDENLVCLQSRKRSSLKIKLVNTIVLQDSVKSIAAVQVRGQKEVLSIREGDKISNDAKVGKIDRMKVVFKNLRNGECEYVETKDKQPRNRRPIKVVSRKKGQPLLNKYKDSRIKNVGNNFKIKKKVRDEMLSNISEVLTQARAIQIKNPDGSLAFKMTEVVPGSIYSKLNIQDGDIITGINGKKFNNLNEIMNLFGKIKEIDQFEISLKRDGVEQNLEYNFE